MLNAFLLLFAFVAAQLLAGALSLVTARALSAGVPSAVWQGYSLLLCSVLLIALLRATRLLRGNLFSRGTSARFSPAVRCGVDTLAVVITLCLSLGLSALLRPLALSDFGTVENFSAMCASPLCLLLLCVVGPVTEELVFRAGIIDALRQRGASAQAAGWLSALAFALVHVNPAQAVPAFFLGVLLGEAYLSTGSLRLPVLMHVANNTVAVVLLHFPEVESAAFGHTAAGQIAVGGGLLAADALLICIVKRWVATQSVARG